MASCGVTPIADMLTQVCAIIKLLSDCFRVTLDYLSAGCGLGCVGCVRLFLPMRATERAPSHRAGALHQRVCALTNSHASLGFRHHAHHDGLLPPCAHTPKNVLCHMSLRGWAWGRKAIGRLRRMLSEAAPSTVPASNTLAPA